jgi:hypothetical protein
MSPPIEKTASIPFSNRKESYLGRQLIPLNEINFRVIFRMEYLLKLPRLIIVIRVPDKRFESSYGRGDA